jgi:tetratricopeptide (TPR) repeat protein
VSLGFQQIPAEDPADTALRQGLANLRAKRFADAQKPLEDAFAIAKEARFKKRAADALLQVYRETANHEKYLETADFIIANSEHKTAPSVTWTQVGGFLHFSGKIDNGIKRYESKLKAQPEDLAALVVLCEVYQNSNRANKPRAKELQILLQSLNKRIATKHAQHLEAEAAKKTAEAAWNLKNAAQFWLEAEEPEAALAAAKASITLPAESRTPILTLQWHEGLGDVFSTLNESALAVKEFEAAVQVAPEGVLKTNLQKKLDQAKGQLK